MNPIKIFPSLIASNLFKLEATMVTLEPVCDGFHIDIMDNHFVPNLTWGPLFVNQIATFSNKPLSVHLMVEKPETIIDQLKLKPRSTLAFHVETTSDVDSIISRITSKKLLVSIALNPTTPLETIFPYLKKVDEVLLMSVAPGFSSQKFLPESYTRLQALVSYKKQHDLSFAIAMDGGINQNNIHELTRKGCSTFCIGSAVFDATNPVTEVKALYAHALEG